MDSVEKVLTLYNDILKLKTSGLSLARSLRRAKKSLTTFKRVQAIAELKITRPRMFAEVRLRHDHDFIKPFRYIAL